MASIHTNSVREELERIKSDFAKQSAEGDVPPSSAMLIKSLIMTRGEKELPEIPKKANGRNGNIAKSDAHNLWARFKKHEASVLRFAREPHVAFTNNRSERDLRMAKVKQKVSGCFRSKIYAEAYCRISSYLQTMANKGINPLIAIQMVFNGDVEVKGGE